MRKNITVADNSGARLVRYLIPFREVMVELRKITAVCGASVLVKNETFLEVKLTLSALESEVLEAERTQIMQQLFECCIHVTGADQQHTSTY